MASRTPEVVVFNLYQHDLPHGSGVLIRDVADLFPEIVAGGTGHALVSPANSLGFMDGGIDLAYCELLPSVQRKVYDGIRALGMPTELRRPHLPVGCAMGFACDGITVISAPTMYLPGDISMTDNVVRATEAAMGVATALGIRRAYVPLMGTGYGKVRATDALAQMRTGMNASRCSPAPPGVRITIGTYTYYLPPDDVLDVIRRQQRVSYDLTEFGCRSPLCVQ